MSSGGGKDAHNPDAIPAELKSRPQWLNWRLIPGENGQRTKVPTSPEMGQSIDPLDPANWRGFDDALRSLGSDYADGIGFVFSEDDPFAGVDLDHVLDPETGEIETWALEVVESLDSYTEVSPSGTGLHVIIKGELPGSRNRRGKIEMYDSGRFFSVTGERYPSTPRQPRDRQADLDAVYAEHIAPAGAEGSRTSSRSPPPSACR